MMRLVFKCFIEPAVWSHFIITAFNCIAFYLNKFPAKSTLILKGCK